VWSWVEIQQPIICRLTEYMVGCAWSGLRRLSPFALEYLTFKLQLQWNLNRGRHETLFLGIIFLHNIQRFWAPMSRARSLGTVGMIMRLLTMTVIIFISRCTEQIVCVGNVWVGTGNWSSGIVATTRSTLPEVLLVCTQSL